MSNKVNLNEYKQQVTTFFNRRTNYDKEGNFHPRLADCLLELVKPHLHRGQKVLDIATGTGLVAIPAAHIVGSEGKVVGVDISSGMLSQAQRKIEAEGLQNIELIEADAEYINFNDDFDAILCSSAFVWLSDIPTALHNWYRWLKKGGLVAFSCFSETSFITPVVIRACAKHGILLPNINEPLGTPEKCHNLLQQAGFQNIEVKTEQFGNYLTLGDAKRKWNGEWLHPQGNPLSDLSPEKLELLLAEYAAVEAIATQGFWHDVTTFLVLARK